MALIALIIEVFILARVEQRKYGFWFTPVTLLGYPFLFVCLLSYFFSEKLGFMPLYVPCLWVWVVGIFLFWVVGYLLHLLFYRNKAIQNPFEGINVISQLSAIKVICFVLCLICYQGVARVYLKTGNFSSLEYGIVLGHGIVGYASILLCFFCIYLICSFAKKPYKKDIGTIIIIFLTIFFCLLYGSKSKMITTVAGGILGFFIIRRIQIRFKYILAVIGFGVLVFYGIYSFSFGHSASWDFILKHFIFYTNSGLLCFSEHVRKGLETSIDSFFLFVPFENVYYKIIGKELVDTASRLFVNIGGGYRSNVNTFFGAIYIYGGIGGGIMTVLIWSFATYAVLIAAIKKETSFFILYLYMAIWLLMGWFDIYFNTIGFYLIYSLPFLWLFVKGYVRKKRNNNK